MALRRLGGSALLVLALAVVACSPGATVAPTSAPLPTAQPDPPITLQVPAEAAAGSEFQVGWTGEERSGDFVVVVPAGTTTWVESAESPYFNATLGNPMTLTAPAAAGDYEVWFLKGGLETVQLIKARAPLKVT